MGELNFAILSAGNIAGVMAGTISRMAGEVTPYAIGARDGARAKVMAEKYGFKKSYGSYEDLVRDTNVDLVYVASPHSHHSEHVKLCLNHGKHVLCEKAFTANAAQAREITALAKEKGLFLGEAVWTRFMPWVSRARDLIDQGVIGEIQSVLCSFGNPHLNVKRMVDPALAGGALLDTGIYTLTFASLILGTDVRKLSGEAVLTDRGVDAHNSVTLIYESGKMAALSSSMTAVLPNTGVVCGCSGHMTMRDFWMCQRITVRAGDKQPYDITCPFDINGYEYEVRAALKAISDGRLYCDAMPWAESIRIMEMMDGLRSMWGVRYPFE